MTSTMRLEKKELGVLRCRCEALLGCVSACSAAMGST